MDQLIPTKQQDFLDEDPAIRGQNYVCLSFLSPEDLLRDKDAFMFEKYLEKFSVDMNKISNELSDKFPEVGQVLSNLKDVYPQIFNPAEIQEDFRFFKSTESERLDKEFHELKEFRTSVRGIKVRGVFDTVVEAKNRADFLKRQGDKFDIFIGQVGCWCPWSPNPNDIADSEYAETQLNTFMKQYKDNMSYKDTVYEKRKQDMINQSGKQSKTTISVESIAEALNETDPWTKAKAAESEGQV
jgi:Family of unknown function (DUF5832)